MQNAGNNGALIQSDDRDDSHLWIVSDLVCLIDHVQASMKLIELAVAGKSPLDNQETAADVVVLDDLTPRYVKVNAALNTCNASLGVALQFLLDNKTLMDGIGSPGTIPIWPAPQFDVRHSSRG